MNKLFSLIVMLLLFSCTKQASKISLLESYDLTWASTGDNVVKIFPAKENGLDPWLMYDGPAKDIDVNYKIMSFNFNADEYKERKTANNLEIENVFFRSPSYDNAGEAENDFKHAVKKFGKDSKFRECQGRSVYTWVLTNGEGVVASLDKAKAPETSGWLIRIYNPNKKFSTDDLFKTFPDCNE